MNVYASLDGAEYIAFQIAEKTGRDLTSMVVHLALGDRDEPKTAWGLCLIEPSDVPDRVTCRTLIGDGSVLFEEPGTYVPWIRLTFGDDESEVIVRRRENDLVTIR